MVTKKTTKKNALSGKEREAHQEAFFTSQTKGVLNPRTGKLEANQVATRRSTETKSGISQLEYESTVRAREYRDKLMEAEGLDADSFINKQYSRTGVKEVISTTVYPVKAKEALAKANLRAVQKSINEQGFNGEMPVTTQAEASMYSDHALRTCYFENGTLKPMVDYRESKGGYGFTDPSGTFQVSPIQSGNIDDYTPVALNGQGTNAGNTAPSGSTASSNLGTGLLYLGLGAAVIAGMVIVSRGGKQ